MTARVRVRSLAKINLDLRVLNKRPDGYHELRTIFQTVSLADTIDIEYTAGRTRIDLKSNLNIPDNLIVRAADSVLKAAGRRGRIGFVLQKRIPLGAGLGGGSSNAAAVLLALPALLGKQLRLDRLMELAAGLGSDVPFFLLGGTAAGIGRGTELYPLPELPSLPVLLITPGIHVSTAEAYGALNRGASGHIAPADWRTGVNDFEMVVFEQHPQLESIKGKLERLGARPALMSGSGSTVFGIFPNRQIRDRAVGPFRKEFGDGGVHAVSMVSRSRYQALWRSKLRAFVDSKVWPWPQQDRYAR